MIREQCENIVRLDLPFPRRHSPTATLEELRLLPNRQLFLLVAAAVTMPPIKFLCLHGLGTNAAVRVRDLAPSLFSPDGYTDEMDRSLNPN